MALYSLYETTMRRKSLGSRSGSLALGKNAVKKSEEYCPHCNFAVAKGDPGRVRTKDGGVAHQKCVKDKD